MLIVYFSSLTETTKRFVDKVGLPAQRIPLRRTDPAPIIDEPYVLICPTYGGGVSMTHVNTKPVPPQVIKFLNDEHNRSYIRGVIASGNSNFGTDYGLAGDVISEKCNVPYLFRFELLGTYDDVLRVRNQLIEHADRLGLLPLTPEQEEALESVGQLPGQENAQRLAQLREKYTNKYRNADR